jgi:conjugative transfer region protein TrbK
MSRSIASSMPRKSAPMMQPGATICLRPKPNEDVEPDAAPVPFTPFNTVFPLINALTTSQHASNPAIGRPISCCSRPTVRTFSSFTSAPHASRSSCIRPTRPPQPLWPPSRSSLLSCRHSCAEPSPSTMAMSLLCTTNLPLPRTSRPTSAHPIHLGKRAVLKTQSVACAACCRQKQISAHCRQPTSSQGRKSTTTPHANVLTSRPRPRSCQNYCCTSNVTPSGLVRKDEAQDPRIAQPAPPVTDPLREELTRCQELGEAGPRDATCLAAWATARRRFLGDGTRSSQPRNRTVIHKNSNWPELIEVPSDATPTLGRSE